MCSNKSYTECKENLRYRIEITGIVQGVGFRPFIFNLAKSLYLSGWVKNESSKVIIEVEGPSEGLELFVARIQTEAPPLAKIRSIITLENLKTTGGEGFEIIQSSRGECREVYISSDISICGDCERELFDRTNRRYLYPFINCTNCGPRFTIVNGIPYDRVNTTMKRFDMCKCCENEYSDPSDRRYHAQPVSCFECGPALKLLDNTGTEIPEIDPIKETAKYLKNGAVIAVKGLGGYHLACDAENKEAVAMLRKRKVRDEKPFAIMAKDYETALKHCEINDKEKELLQSGKRPIVLLKKREDCTLSENIAPGNKYLGVMLPYTPVHLLLLNHGEEGTLLDTLVMTSGNRSGEPIYFEEDDALENLNDITDYFLVNDRDIYIRTDDSVTRVFRDNEFIIRRSRGYVPLPITIDISKLKSKGFEADNAIPSILACGGELKSTFCINKGDEFILSHHIGDLENVETLSSFEEGIEHFKRIFRVNIGTIVHDLHPEYLSTKYAFEAVVDRKIAVQHHHAHIASCMAENNLFEKVIGIAFDGTGFGEDGRLWGGEFFSGDLTGFKREGHLEYVKLPGGEMAIKEPWRMALSYLYNIQTGGNSYPYSYSDKLGLKYGDVLLLDSIAGEKINAVLSILEKGINSPETSSMGRLFDAVAALAGVRTTINYEGQAAIELEYIASKDCSESYEFEINDSKDFFVIVTKQIISGVIKDIADKVPAKIISSKFHETVAEIVLKGSMKIKQRTNLNKAVLSGGVFQNLTLIGKAKDKLEAAGFEVYIHSKVPSNDGGVSLGQAVLALSRYIHM